MNHNPIPTDTLHVEVVKIVPLFEILKAIGHPDMENEGTDAFSGITYGDALHTVCTGWRLFDMIDEHLSSHDDGHGGITYTGEQSDRIRDFLYELADAGIHIDMEG